MNHPKRTYPIFPRALTCLALLVWMLAAWLAQPSPAHAAAMTFETPGQDGARRISAEVVDVQGMPYVALPALARQLGAATQREGVRFQVQIGDSSAVATVNDTRVSTTARTFFLTDPLILRDNEVLLSTRDVPGFFGQAFGVSIAAADTPAVSSAEAPPIPEPNALPPLEQVELDPAGDADEMPAPVFEESGPEEEADLDEMEEDMLASDSLLAAEDAGQAPSAGKGQSEESGGLAGAPAEVLLPMQAVVIDPGHGGNDTGTLGEGGFAEKELTLAVANHLRRLLKERSGLRIYMTRTEDRDLSLRDRANLANEQQADFLVSIHAGASPAQQAHGFEVFAPASPPLGRTGLGSPGSTSDAGRLVNEELGLRIAGVVDASLRDAADASSRGVRKAPLRLFAEASMPGVLVEVGCLTNGAEEQLLRTEAHQIRLAEGIAEALLAVSGAGKETAS